MTPHTTHVPPARRSDWRGAIAVVTALIAIKAAGIALWLVLMLR